MSTMMREMFAFFLLQFYANKGPKPNEITSLFFHNPPPALFEHIIQCMIKHGYGFLSTQELQTLLEEKKESYNKVLITLDDGWRGNLDLLPIIEKYRVPITIFISTEPALEGNYWWEYASHHGQEAITNVEDVEDYKKLPESDFREKIALLKENITLERSSMTLEEVKKISRHELVTIGAHTWSHPILKNCSYNSQLKELTDSKEMLESWIGKPVNYLAYPNGDYNKDTLEIVEKAGYQLCFTVQPDTINPAKTKTMEIPRISIEDEQGKYESLSKAVGAWHKFKCLLQFNA